jgi:L-threonylcarbamoyladenylate synthase
MTILFTIESDHIDEIKMQELGRIIREGGTVIFPTETVYGLGANAFCDFAADKIYMAKGRPSDSPLIVHICNIEQLNQITDIVPKKAQALMDKFWPGPLTLLFKKKDTISDRITSNLPTVAVRMPDSKIALALIEKAGVPIAAPSANLSGKPSPTRAEHVIHDMMGRVDAIIKGDDCRVGLESTVIDVMHDPPVILRPGGITLEQIAEVLDSVIYDPALDRYDGTLIPKSPGQKYTHYSPIGQVILFSGESGKMRECISKEAKSCVEASKKVMVIGTNENVENYKDGIIFSLGSRTNLEEISSNLFSLLIKADQLGAEIILIEGFTETGLGKTIMNRLKKASGGTIIRCGD